MFDLNDAITKWRLDLIQRETYTKADIDELENHLRDEIENLSGTNLTAQEVFLVAAGRLGDGGELAHEFAKVNQQIIWSRRFLWMTVGLFVFFLTSLLAQAVSQCCLWLFTKGATKGIKFWQ